MTTLATLVVSLTGDIGGFVKEMQKAEKQSEKSGSAIGKAFDAIGTGAKLAAGLAVTGFVAVGTAAFGAAMKMDEAYDTIRIGTGATGDALEGLKDDFKAVFTSVPADAEAAAGVITAFNQRLGLSGPLLQDLSANVLEASRLMGGDATKNAELFSRVIGDWGVPVENSSEALDKLFKTSQTTGVGLDRLMTTIVAYGSPMRLMGFSFEESAALLGKWEKEGVNTELVLGSLRVAAGKFARENVPLQKGLADTIERIQGAKTSSEGLAIAMEVFGARAGPDMAAAIMEGRFAIDDLVKGIEDSQGAVMDAAEATEDFPEKFKKMVNKAEVALAPLGLAIMDAIGTALDAIGPFVDEAMPQIIEAFKSTVQWIEQNLGPAFDFIIAALGDVVEWVKVNWPAIQEAITGAFEKAKAFLEPIINAIRSFIESVFSAIGQFVATHGEDIKTFLTNAWETVRGIIETVATIISTVITSVFGGIATWIQENQEDVQRVIGDVWNAIKTVVETVLGVISGIVNTVLSIIRGDWEGAWQSIKTTVETIWNGIKTFVETVLGGIFKWIVDNFIKPVTAAWDNFWGGLKATAESVVNFIAGIVQGIKDAIEGAIQALNDLLNAGGPTPGSPGMPVPGGPALPGPGMAAGGTFMVPPGFPNDSYPAWFTSGEVVNVTPRGMARAAGGAGGGSFQFSEGAIVIYAQPGQSAREIAREVMDEAARRADARRRGRG